MRYGLFAAILLSFSIFAKAQKLSVEELTIDENGEVSFSCIVEAHHSSREEYELQVYSSIDNFEKPLPLEPIKLKPGVRVPVAFDGNKVVGDYEGSIEFDFAMAATFFPVEIVESPKKLKKGKEITISWEDFHESGWYDVEIYQNDLLSQRLVGNYRGTSYTVTLPKDMPKGEYEIRVTPSNQKELFSEGYEVSLKSGKAGLIIGAGGVLAGAGVLLIKLSDNGEELPGPPDLPSN